MKKNFFVGGVGVQCHFPTDAVKKGRIGDILHLHCVNDAEERDFWMGMEKLREGCPTVLFPCGVDGKIAVIYNHNSNPPINLEEVYSMMLRRGFIGFMLHGGTFVFKKDKPIFDKFCRSLGLNFAT